jgi:hypothetical protein
MSKLSNQMVNSTTMDTFLIEVVNIKLCCTLYVYISVFAYMAVYTACKHYSMGGRAV